MNWTAEQFEEHMRRIAPQPVTITADDAVVETRSEAMIQAECTKLMQEDGWRPLRTDPVSDRSKGKGFGEVGMADYLYIRYWAWSSASKWQADLLWIEYKAPKGEPQKHQTEWHTKERSRGALTLIAGVDFPASVAGFTEWYKASGLNRGGVR